MEQIFYWIGLVFVCLSTLGGLVLSIYFFLALMVQKLGDSQTLANYLVHKKTFKHWYYKIRRK